VKGDRALRAGFDQAADLVAVALPILEQRQDQQLGAALLHLAVENCGRHIWL
jgi:hypothetical protein